LASIASVAQVRAFSRTKDSTGANCIEIDCGNVASAGPCSGDYGTTIQIRDIFYKLPARRKFLKTANTEMGHIIEQFTRIALANENLDLTLIRNGKELYRLSAEDDIHRRITKLFPLLSNDISENLLETQSGEKGMHIRALMGKPVISRTNNRFQYVFLNGRFIRDKFISHAIKEAYRGLLEPGRFPVVFLFIKMGFEDYDVNVHPTKIEVRFYNANLVHSQILGAMREKLLGMNLEMPGRLPEIQDARSASLRSPPVRDSRIADAMAEFFRKHRPAQMQQQLGFRSSAPGKVHAVSREKSVQYEKKFLQIHDSFIVEQTEEGFVIIDQHALHERIIYENLSRRLRNSKLQSQKLLIPESFEVTVSAEEALKSNSGLMDKLGIELVPFGPRTMAVQAFPSLLSNVQPVDFIQDLVDLLESKDAKLDSERLLDEVLNMAACKAAIKAGQKLTDSEIEHLLAERQSAESASRCPHGRPTTIKFSISDLEKQFKRT